MLYKNFGRISVKAKKAKKCVDKYVSACYYQIADVTIKLGTHKIVCVCFLFKKEAYVWIREI